MLIKTLPVGQLETNCYVVTNPDTLECVVIDPGDESNTILDYIESNRLTCKAIMLTHGHFDHVGACAVLAEETGAPVYMNEKDDAKNMKSNVFPYTLPENGKYYGDGDTVEAAGITFEVTETPGHTPGGVVICADGAIFTGDTLFRGSRGRADIVGGDADRLLESLGKICKMDDSLEIYPGHMESSTLVREKAFNYYCRQAMQKYG